MIKIFLCFHKKKQKNVTRIWCYETMEKPVAGSLCFMFMEKLGASLSQGFKC